MRAYGEERRVVVVFSKGNGRSWRLRHVKKRVRDILSSDFDERLREIDER